MAKRKRLTPARPGYLDGPADGMRAPETKSMPQAGAAPIARIAGDSASHAALSALSDAMAEARAKGLMIAELPLSAIDEGHLVRDRLEQDEDEMAALMGSLRARGQQTPIEVVALERPVGGFTHGLISGWRRLTALKRLAKVEAKAEDGQDFATVKALVVQPETAQDAYVAMVEENEIRVDLSFYERARIAVRALHEGVFDTQRAALQGLFANVTRSKRSKIGSFVSVVEALDAVLRFPSAIPERLGLALAREIGRDPEFAGELRAALAAGPREAPAAEMQILKSALSARQKAAKTPVTEPDRPRIRDLNVAPKERHITQAAAGVRMSYSPERNQVELVGEGVTSALVDDLQAWLRRR